MKDRVPTQPNRVKITRSDGSIEYVIWERADEPTQEGTPLNKASLFSDSVSERYGLDDGTPSQGFELLTKEWSVAVTRTDWIEAFPDTQYTKTISVDGMKSAYNPLVSLKLTSATATIADQYQEQFSKIVLIETHDGYIEIYATSPVEFTIALRLKGV